MIMDNLFFLLRSGRGVVQFDSFARLSAVFNRYIFHLILHRSFNQQSEQTMARNNKIPFKYRSPPFKPRFLAFRPPDCPSLITVKFGLAFIILLNWIINVHVLQYPCVCTRSWLSKDYYNQRKLLIKLKLKWWRIEILNKVTEEQCFVLDSKIFQQTELQNASIYQHRLEDMDECPALIGRIIGLNDQIERLQNQQNLNTELGTSNQEFDHRVKF